MVFSLCHKTIQPPGAQSS